MDAFFWDVVIDVTMFGVLCLTLVCLIGVCHIAWAFRRDILKKLREVLR